MIAEAQFLEERRTTGVKEMLQDATKLISKLRFLVEEVQYETVCVCVFALSPCYFLTSRSCTHSAPAHGARCVRVDAQQQQACGVRSARRQGPAVLQQPGGQRDPLWQDHNAVPEGERVQEPLPAARDQLMRLCRRSLRGSASQACLSKLSWTRTCGSEPVRTPATCWRTCLRDSLHPQGALTPATPPHTCSAPVRRKQETSRQGPGTE